MRFFTLIFLSVLCGLLGHPATAQDDGGFSKLPALPANAMDDGAPINLSPDGPAVIRLNEDAASVIIGNPAQATAVLESPRMIMLIPQQPGATKIMALDANGKTLLNRHVLVGGGKSNFIRINRACGRSKKACQPVSMYYCPGRCYETTLPQPGGEAATITGDTAAPVNIAPPSAPADAPAVPESIGENPISLDDGVAE